MVEIRLVPIETSEAKERTERIMGLLWAGALRRIQPEKLYLVDKQKKKETGVRKTFRSA